jgi:hypothetical protein
MDKPPERFWLALEKLVRQSQIVISGILVRRETLL